MFASDDNRSLHIIKTTTGSRKLSRVSICVRLGLFAYICSGCTKATFVLLSGHGFQRMFSQNPTGMVDATEPTNRCMPTGNVDASGTIFPLSWLHSVDSTWSKGWRRYDP